MSNYSDNPGSCRVDFFRTSGKWYDSQEMDWSKEYNSHDIIQSFKDIIFSHVGNHYIGMTAICLDPYHKNSHPVMVTYTGLKG